MLQLKAVYLSVYSQDLPVTQAYNYSIILIIQFISHGEKMKDMYVSD